ncbi:MAG TPA: hypothetical protein VH682_07390 [Gemmataceae bacterium]|jgi:hypothetical protein
MRMHDAIPHGLLPTGRFVLFLLVLLPVPCASAGGAEAKRDAKEAAKMVEAIANRNKAPKIVKRRTFLPREVPLYPKDYDWKEEERVHEAIAKLEENMSVELWDALVQKTNDRRYCTASYSGSSADVYIDSVGTICQELAYDRLCYVFEKHLPSLPPHGRPFYLENVWEDLIAWRRERKNKSLYQLQVEVCEIALRELPKVNVERVSDEEKAEARKKIEAEIAKLRRTNRPVLRNPGRWYMPRYPRREAERVREAYEKGTLEEFRSGLNK